MKKRITLFLALVLSLTMVCGILSFRASAEETLAPIEIKVHYSRADGNYDQWYVYAIGDEGVTDFEVGDGEAVATIYAPSNPYYLIFGIECGEYSWIGSEWSDEEQTTADRDLMALFPELRDVVCGTIHVYVSDADPTRTTVVPGDDVIYTGEERVDIRIHYTRADGNYDGCHIVQTGGTAVTDFEILNGEAVATITAFPNPTDIRFSVAPGGTEYPVQELFPELARVYCGTIHIYLDDASATAEAGLTARCDNTEVASGVCGDGLTWVLTSNGTLTIDGTGAMYDWAGGYDTPWYDHMNSIRLLRLGSGVTTVGNHAFERCYFLSQVLLPDSLERIGIYAFRACYDLTAIDLPWSLRELGLCAFGFSGLREITIPAQVTELSGYIFENCADLTRVVLPEGLETIGYYTFTGCTALTDINIPATVTWFGEGAFSDCTALQEKYEADRPLIQADTPVTAHIEIPDFYTQYYTFVPDKTEGYTFVSQGDTDAIGFIYDSDGNLLAQDDDGGGDFNFAVGHTLEAGRTYYLGLRLYSPNVPGAVTAQVSVSHEYEESVLTPAACAEDGVLEYRCRHCGDSYAAPIPGGHVYSDGFCTRYGLVEAYPLTATGTDGTASINRNAHSYTGFDASPVTSVLAEENGKLMRAEYLPEGNRVVVEYYDGGYALTDSLQIPLELPIFGGIYIGPDCNFLICGQENQEESDEKEVIRVIRYSKNWQRLGSAGFFGGNTTIPFDAGSLRCALVGETLYIHTCHEMYTSRDGKNHQAKLGLAADVNEMTPESGIVTEVELGHVSHSFNQFILVDGGDLVTVDQGDAFPRAVVVNHWAGAAAKGVFNTWTSFNVLPIAENTSHYNYTGVSVGGFAASGSHYLVAGNSCPQTGGINQRTAQRNIFVTATPKDSLSAESTAITWLTDYEEGDNVRVGNPHLVQITADRFCLLWSVEDTVYYCMLNGAGERTSEIFSSPGQLSDCVPIVANGKLVWYVTEYSGPVFYEIDLDPGARILYGDVNSDGKVNGLDVILLRQYIAGWDVAADLKAANVNGDTAGKVNSLDMILLRQYIAGWNVTLGPQDN